MGKKKLLVVDDEENIRFLYKEELEDTGYDVELAADAEEALKTLSVKTPDMVILDIKMPGMNGIELLNKIRETNKDIPVIICSAYNDYKQDFHVWASDAYVVKSSDLSELKEVIKNTLGNKKLRKTRRKEERREEQREEHNRRIEE